MPQTNKIQLRRGLSGAWTSGNPTLTAGEPGFESDTLRLKIGDGSSAWSGLNYIGVYGTGVSGYIPKFSSSQTFSSSLLYDNASSIGINTPNPQSGFVLDNNGAAVIRGQIATNGTINEYANSRFQLHSSAASNSYSYVCNGGGNFGVGFIAPSGRVAISGGVSIGSSYNVTPPTNGLIVQGSVGIGTTSPTYNLQVSGSFGATTKSFRINHPVKLNWSLEYGSLESPYHGVRLTGRDKVIKGIGIVNLPDYLKDLIHNDHSVTIQLTNYKHGKTLYVSNIDLENNRFIVKADRAKTLGELEFFWTLTGVRKDVDHLVVEKEN